MGAPAALEAVRGLKMEVKAEDMAAFLHQLQCDSEPRTPSRQLGGSDTRRMQVYAPPSVTKPLGADVYTNHHHPRSVINIAMVGWSFLCDIPDAPSQYRIPAQLSQQLAENAVSDVLLNTGGGAGLVRAFQVVSRYRRAADDVA